MPGAYETHGLAADRRELSTFGHEPTVGRGAIDLTGAGEAADLGDRASRLLAVEVGDHIPIEVQQQVAEIARRPGAARAASASVGMSALAVSADAELAVAQPGLAAAAEWYARLTLRKSEQTQATYLSTYRRFAIWLSHHTGHPDPPPAALTTDAVAAYITELETRKAAATAKKEHAAINRLANYLHTLGGIDATEILMIAGSRAAARPRRRDPLDAATWKRVKDNVRARLHQGPQGRTSRLAAYRDLALILALGAMGLRSEEARVLTIDSIAPKRADGLTPWLTVCGKGAKTRELPTPPELPTSCSRGLSIATASSPLLESCFHGLVASVLTGASPTPAHARTRTATTAGSPHTHSATPCAP